MLDLVIVGAGPTGLYAAFLAGTNRLKTAIIEASIDLGGQLTLYKEKAIYDVPGFTQIEGGSLIESLYKQYEQYRADMPIHINTQAIDIIELENHYCVKTTTGVFETKTVLLANGGGLFKPRLLEMGVDESLKNIHYFVDDIRKYENQKIVILGGGDSAIDWALSFLTVTKDVTLIHRRHDFRAHMANVEKIQNTGHVLTPYTPKTLFHKGDKIEKILIENLENQTEMTLDVDHLFVFYGVSLAKQSTDLWQVELDHKAIKVDTSMQTNRQGVYAVGNCVYYPGKLKMIGTGFGEAATAIGAITNHLYPERKNPYLAK
jgi:ferredoxin/flavodoxin---NADP+ reductase